MSGVIRLMENAGDDSSDDSDTLVLTTGNDITLVV